MKKNNLLNEIKKLEMEILPLTNLAEHAFNNVKIMGMARNLLNLISIEIKQFFQLKNPQLNNKLNELESEINLFESENNRGKIMTLHKILDLLYDIQVILTNDKS